MPNTRPLPGTDPVSQAVSRSTLMAGCRPIPLIATAYDIRIHGGLAEIVAKRTFCNDEPQSIEATLTFPLPVHAVLYALEAKIGDRIVKAQAQGRTAARATYEDAIDRGKTSVLHEELIKGIHLLSVGHIGPGTEIEITARFALALASVAGRIFLRIPMTVGDVYGSSGLPDSDELIHGGSIGMADVKISCDSGAPKLLGGALIDGAARVCLDAPIHVEIDGWAPRGIAGRAADGRSVKLNIEPAAPGAGAIDAAVVVDHSGSMSDICAQGAGLSKHAAALLGLSEAADDLRGADKLDLWEFDDTPRDLGSADANGWRALIRQLSGPHGGTEIGRALDTVIAKSHARDVLLVTDGKSHALDVQKLGRSGRRFTVVLIGEDSLEANIGHLAQLSGGDIFIPDRADVTGAVRSALKAIRLAGCDAREAHLRRCGMVVGARWSKDRLDPSDDGLSRAVAAYAASLLLPSR